MKRRNLLTAAAAGAVAGRLTARPKPTPTPTALLTTTSSGSVCTEWAEEGAGAAGTAPDPALWVAETTQSWQPANELQYYTGGNTRNTFYDGQGHLVLRAIKEPINGKSYSSGKLTTRKTDGTGRFRYGLIQARIWVPTGTGVLPAFWLLGEDNLPELAWPRCGEVDIMEAPASAATLNQLHQGTHMADTTTGADHPLGVPYTTNSSGWGGWHVYSVAWEPDTLSFYIDHKLTGTITSADAGPSAHWPFDRGPMSIILTLAVGGWAGTPDPTWTQQDMLVDFVRVYS